MKNRIYTIVCVAVIIGAIVWIAASFVQRRGGGVSPAPIAGMPERDTMPLTSMEFRERVVDFGRVSADTLLCATFVARNTGAKPLVIYYVNPDCSCTGYTLSKPVVQPGDTLSIVLKLDTRHKSGLHRLYTIVRANTEDQLYRLMLKAEVDPS